MVGERRKSRGRERRRTRGKRGVIEEEVERTCRIFSYRK